MSEEGCCCLCPSFVGVIILGCLQTLFFIGCIALFFIEAPLDYESITLISVISALFIVPYLWVWLNQENICARLTLFWSGVISSLLGFCFFTFILMLVLMGFQITVLNEGGTYDEDNETLHVAKVVVGYILYIIGAAFGLLCLWNFYTE